MTTDLDILLMIYSTIWIAELTVQTFPKTEEQSKYLTYMRIAFLVGMFFIEPNQQTMNNLEKDHSPVMVFVMEIFLRLMPIIVLVFVGTILRPLLTIVIEWMFEHTINQQTKELFREPQQPTKYYQGQLLTETATGDTYIVVDSEPGTVTVRKMRKARNGAIVMHDINEPSRYIKDKEINRFTIARTN